VLRALADTGASSNIILEAYTSKYIMKDKFAKKNGTISVVSDFRRLSPLPQRHPFPIPKIGDVIRSMVRDGTGETLNCWYESQCIQIKVLRRTD
jgi:hypothetical protein